MMKKWLRRILLCIILVFVIWAGYLYNCANKSRGYNVVIECVKNGQYGPRHSIGSGVVISENGLIITARHVLKDADRVRVTLSDGRVFDGKYRYLDADNDVGLIYLAVDVNDYIVLGDSNDIVPHNIIYNIGNAKGFWNNSISFGIVHSVNFERLYFGEDCKFIMARMKVYGGCSGGGIYHYKKLIGIAVKGSTGATFIVPSNVCKKVIEDYRNASKE